MITNRKVVEIWGPVLVDDMPLSQSDADELLRLANSWIAAGEQRLKDAREGFTNLSIKEADAVNSVYQSLAQSLAKKVGTLRGLSVPKVPKKKEESS